MGVDPKYWKSCFFVRDITISIVAGTFEAHLRKWVVGPHPWAGLGFHRGLAPKAHVACA
jgi:hypothetical protein